MERGVRSMSEAKAQRIRSLRWKRPALASMGWDTMRTELDEIREACYDIHWFTDQDDETLINALDGDEDEAWEFRMAFSGLEANADNLEEAISENFGHWDWEEREREFNDCTVALIGNRYRMVGYDSDEEDYFSLTSYDAELAQSEAGKRLMRLTKKEMLATIGQCVGILVAFLDLRQQYDYLKATFDILRDENTSMLKQVKEIEQAYLDAVTTDPYSREGKAARERFDRLLDALPARAWIE